MLALFLVGTTSACAYYNTFYFAKKHFAQAETLREASETDLVPPEAVKRYDDSILQCKKVLNFHAGSRWTDDAIYLMGASYYGKAAYDSSLITLDGLLENFPDSDFVPQAHFLRGLSFHERGLYEEMNDAFESALAEDPEMEEKADIFYTRAASAEKQGERGRAIQGYRELVDTFPESERGEEGLLEIGRLYFEEGIYDSALYAFRELADQTKVQERYETSQIQMAQSLIRLGRSGEAIERLERQLPKEEATADRRQRNEYPSRVRLGMAQAHNRLQQHERAVEILRDIVELDPGSGSASEAQYQIGYTYETYLDSLDAAETAYEEAAKTSSRSTFRDLARTRLTNLKKFRSLAKEAGSETENSGEEKRAEAGLKIAELYYYSQRDVAAALAQYTKVRNDFPDTENAARAAYALAWIHVEEDSLDDIVGFDLFREVVNEYPASSQARSAIDFLYAADEDTSGLSALLVEPEPEPEPEPEVGEGTNGDGVLSSEEGEASTQPGRNRFGLGPNPPGHAVDDSLGISVLSDSLGISVLSDSLGIPTLSDSMGTPLPVGADSSAGTPSPDAPTSKLPLPGPRGRTPRFVEIDSLGIAPESVPDTMEADPTPDPDEEE